MNKELNAAEAVYGFVGWLTSREERTVMSAKDDCAPIAELIKRFCTENNLPEVSDQWPLNLIHPSGEVAVPNAEIALLKRSLLDAEAAAPQPSPTAKAAEGVPAPQQPAQDDALIRQLVEALEGYRRNHNDTQPCDAERAGRARLEGTVGAQGGDYGSEFDHCPALKASKLASHASPATRAASAIADISPAL